uniref:Uncharacterized protein n=1 Tax=Anopheles farauti TaxID=69004 RepID=A0A182QPL6_9DIPT
MCAGRFATLSVAVAGRNLVNPHDAARQRLKWNGETVDDMIHFRGQTSGSDTDDPRLGPTAPWNDAAVPPVYREFTINFVLSPSSHSWSAGKGTVRPAPTPTPPLASHDRPSVDLLLRSDFRSLSTSRLWNLFRLLWLPATAAGTAAPFVPFGGLLPELAFDGLEAISELCEVREELRENCDREARCDMYIG